MMISTSGTSGTVGLGDRFLFRGRVWGHVITVLRVRCCYPQVIDSMGVGMMAWHGMDCMAWQREAFAIREMISGWDVSCLAWFPFSWPVFM